MDKFKKKIRICLRADVYLGVFLGLVWGRTQVKTQQIFPIPKFLVLHFGENFMKILPKISML